MVFYGIDLVYITFSGSSWFMTGYIYKCLILNVFEGEGLREGHVNGK